MTEKTVTTVRVVGDKIQVEGAAHDVLDVNPARGDWVTVDGTHFHVWLIRGIDVWRIDIPRHVQVSREAQS